MIHHTKTSRSGRNERGSVLVAVIFVALLLSGLIAWAFTDSHSSAKTSMMRENYAQAQAAAEYGVELAIAQLTTLGTGAESGETVGDFVHGEFSSTGTPNFYTTSEGTARDQRRIQGLMDDQQFRVRVRSARLAHDVNNDGANPTMPRSWLLRPDSFEYNSAAARYDDLYEITATAQNHLAASGRAVQPMLYPTASVQAVVSMGNTGSKDTLVENRGFFIPHPGLMQANNINISGEDHYINNFFVEGGSAYTVEKTEVSQGSSSASEVSNSDGGYWNAGQATLNYMRNDYPLPYYPRTKSFSSSTNDRAMVSIGQRTRPAGGADYTTSTSGTITQNKPETWNEEVKTFATNPVAQEADIYLIGGKTYSSAGYSVTTLAPKYPWTIKETTASAATKGKLEPPLGDFDDLLRIYIVRAGSSTATRSNQTVQLSDRASAPYHSSATPYRNYKGKTVSIPYDTNIDGDFMNFVGKKLYDLEHIGAAASSNAYTSITLPWYNDPFDNSTVTERVPRYFSRQYVVRRKPGTEYDNAPTLQILAMNVKPEDIAVPNDSAKVKLAGTLIEGILLNTSGNPVNFAGSSITWAASTSSRNSTSSGKKVLWELAAGEPDPIFVWDSGKSLYVPVEDSIVIQLRNYPNTWNNKNEDQYFGGSVASPNETRLNSDLNPMLTARWPNLLKDVVEGTENLARDKKKYRVKWSDLGLEGIKATSPSVPTSTSGSYSAANAFPDSVNYKPAGSYRYNGVYITRSSMPDETYQWFKWDGSYIWKDFYVTGDGNTAHIQTSKNDSFSSTTTSSTFATYLKNKNVMARPFDIDELMGAVMKHDFRTLESQKYGKVVVVDADGNGLKKDAEDNYRDANGDIKDPIPLVLTKPVRNEHEVWTGWRASGPDDENYDPGIVVHDPNEPDAEPKIYTTMSDFLLDVPSKENDEWVVKKGVTLLTMIEDQWENPDWDYNDLAFVATIYPAIMIEGGHSIETGVSKNYQQWWEQDQTEGLTGGESTAAITTNGIDGRVDYEEAFSYLWSNLLPKDWFALSDSYRAELVTRAVDSGAISRPSEDYKEFPKDHSGDSADWASDSVRKDVIACLSQNMFSMMNAGSNSFTIFEYRGDFRLKMANVDWIEAEMPSYVYLSDPPPLYDSDGARSTIYYTSNDAAYYGALWDTEFARLKKFFIENPDELETWSSYTNKTLHGDKMAQVWFYRYWETVGADDRRLFAAGDFDQLIGASDVLGYDYYKNKLKDWCLINHMASLGYQAEFIDQRTADIIRALVAINDGSDGQATSFRVLRKTISPREYAAGIFNQNQIITDQNMRTVVVAEGPAETWSQDGDVPSFKQERLSYLAGEMKQRSDANPAGAVYPYAEGQHIAVTGAYDKKEVLQADGSRVYIQAFLAQSDENGAWQDGSFTSANGSDAAPAVVRDYTAEGEGGWTVYRTLADAVRRCYQPYYKNQPEMIEEIYQRWGMKDKRYSIGWHRGGDGDGDAEYKETLAENYLLDHTEITLLGVDRFHPYYEINIDGQQVIQRRREYEKDDEGQVVDSKKFTETVPVKTEDDMPTFVFPDQIDGNGTLVINGNVLIQDTFAFNGLFIVLGSVTVESNYKPDRIVYGADGNPIYIAVADDGTSKQYSLSHDDDGYYYIDEAGNEVRENADGSAFSEDDFARAKDIPDESDYTGHLVVQGAMMAGGTVRTTSAEEGGEPGQISVYSSIDALNDLNELLPDGTRVLQRLVWNHNDNINVQSIWADTLDPVRK